MSKETDDIYKAQAQQKQYEYFGKMPILKKVVALYQEQCAQVAKEPANYSLKYVVSKLEAIIFLEHCSTFGTVGALVTYDVKVHIFEHNALLNGWHYTMPVKIITQGVAGKDLSGNDIILAQAIVRWK